MRLRFEGSIAGFGTSCGTRVVLGHWVRSPFGPFSDVMLERPDGKRLLLAPTREVADFIAGTYRFEEVRVAPVVVDVVGHDWTIGAPELDVRFTVGRRGPLGLLLRAVPSRLATRPLWCALTDVPARLLPGVRACGRTGGGRREWYGAQDLRPITAATAVFEGRDLGLLRPVDPAVRFGFGSTPRSPAIVRIVTTVQMNV
ncbi:hypothetical protein LN042_12715 [Kitasatospora sp. RB6PN24]|nr:hypothetical protein [Kitasatospora humi]